jgi:hypothetical protein
MSHCPPATDCCQEGLLAIEIFTGPPGLPGATGATGSGGGGGGGYITQWIDSDGSASYLLAGLGNDARHFRVTVCGVEQRPNTNFTTSSSGGGVITFPVAIPANNQIAVQRIL